MVRRGSIMLEAVLVLPLLIFIVFGLIQATFVWTAHQMTLYAAYCGARAALVYHPDDYSGSGGVVKRAAETVLSWISFSHETSSPFRIASDGGAYEVPCSDEIGRQVSVSVSEHGAVGAEDSDVFPSVTVTVDFKYPLIIPIGNLLFAMDAKEDKSGIIRVEENGDWVNMHIVESYTLPKPWSTKTFPKIPSADKAGLGIK